MATPSPANQPVFAAPAVAEPAAGGNVPLLLLFLPALGLAVAVAAVAGGRGQLVAPLVGMVSGLLVLALNSPAWLVVSLLLTEFSVYGYYLPGAVTLRLATALIAGAVVGLLILRGARVDHRPAQPLLLVGCAFVTLATVGNLLHSDVDYSFKYLRYQLAQLLVLLAVAYLIQNRRDLARVAAAALAVGILSSVVALWQHYDGMSAPYAEGSFSRLSNYAGRVMGITPSPIHQANDMSFLLLPLLGVLICGSSRENGARPLLVPVVPLVAAGLYFTSTRSTMLAVGAGLVTLGLLLKGTARFAVLGAVVLAGLMYPVLKGTGTVEARFYRDADDDRSAAAHLALWQVGLAVALANPIVGLGHEQFEEVSLDYRSEVSSDAVGGLSSIGQDRPHNDFLSVWMSWGILAILAYLGLFAAAAWNYLRAARSGDFLIRGLAVGCLAGLVRYAVDSAFHNFLDSSTLLWALAGLSVVLVRLAGPPLTTGLPAPATASWSGAGAARSLSLERRRVHRPLPG